jgi:hypothetical protein
MPHGSAVIIDIPPLNFDTMAKLQGDLLITGSLGTLSAYRMKGIDQIIVRTKGGPSAEKIRHSPRFQNTRKNNTEFGACAKAASCVRNAIRPLWLMADHNITPLLNGMCKKIQLLDAQHEWGKRQVLFSHHPYLLEGFNVNRRASFDSVLHSAVHYTADFNTCTVEVSAPALLPGVNLLLPGQFSFYRLVFTLAVLHDAPVQKAPVIPVSACSEWMHATAGAATQVYTLNCGQSRKPAPGTSLLIGAGIQLSVNGDRPVKYAGTGKILGLVSG